MNKYEDVKVATTPDGDKIIAMSEATFIEILNNIYEASEHQAEDNRLATSARTKTLWQKLSNYTD